MDGGDVLVYESRRLKAAMKQVAPWKLHNEYV